MRNHLRNTRAALAQVFAHFSCLALTGLLAITAFLFAVWFPNLGLIESNNRLCGID